jgi:hypothetical protein
MMRRLLPSIVGALACVAWPLSSAANAAIAYQDTNYTVGATNGYMAIYDNQCDGHSVYSNFYRTSSSGNERQEWYNGCTTHGTYNWGSLWTFRACENIPFWPDDCSGYVYAN